MTTQATTNKFSPQVRGRSVRMVQEHTGECPTRWAAVQSIAAEIGCAAQTLHDWTKKGAAKREVMPSVKHRKHKGLNNRAENSHQPTGQRERQMKRFKSACQAQRFLFAYDGINNLFHLRRRRVPAAQYRAARLKPIRFGPGSPASPLQRNHEHAVLIAPHRDLNLTS